MEIKDFKIGDIYTNAKITSTFKINPQSGMRRGLENNCLVLTCNHVKKEYNDRWENNILYYTGKGLKESSQKFERENKTLRDSNELEIDVYLFEVFKEGEYTFSGKVYLCDTPIIEKQYNKSKKCERDVIIFPLKKCDVDLKEYKNYQKKIMTKKTLKELEELYKQREKVSKKSTKIVNNYNRSLIVKEIALKKAQGICQLCEEQAPFFDKNNSPFLEVHHIVPLSEGGEDSTENVVALCPNCHRKIHILEDENDIKKLKNI